MFDQIFAQAPGRPVEYQGKLLHRTDRIPVSNGQTLRVIIESTNAHWRQGVRLVTEGEVVVHGERFRGNLVLWEDTAEGPTDCTWYSKSGIAHVYNAWDTGNGSANAWFGGAAMIIEELPDGKRYRCNDGYPDDDFDDLVFRIEFPSR